MFSKEMLLLLNMISYLLHQCLVAEKKQNNFFRTQKYDAWSVNHSEHTVIPISKRPLAKHQTALQAF